MKINKNLPPKEWGYSSKKHLDIGCGFDNFRDPFESDSTFGADIMDINKANYYRIIDSRIEVEDDFFDSISAFDVIEHLSREGRPNEFVKFMNELYRILKPGGIFLGVTPAFPNPLSFQDPTHVNIITENTLNYFVGSHPGAKSLGYGFEGNFELLSQFWTTPRIQIRKQNWDRKISLHHLLFTLLMRPSLIRPFVSQMRNPSHIVWVIRKIA